MKISGTKPGSVRNVKASPDVADVGVLHADIRGEGLQDQGADLIGEWQLTVQRLSGVDQVTNAFVCWATGDPSTRKYLGQVRR
jgi:hypothetical protein